MAKSLMEAICSASYLIFARLCVMLGDYKLFGRCVRSSFKLSVAMIFVGVGVAVFFPEARADCSAYNHLAVPSALGASISACSTVDPELGGLRASLAQHGIGILFVNNSNFSYDLHSDHQSPQLYGGQKPTYLANMAPIISYELNSIGLPTGSIFIYEPMLTYSSYEGNGLTAAYTRAAYAYIPFWEKKASIYAGYMDLGGMFNIQGISDVVGATVLGAGSTLSGQLGLSGYAPTPSIILSLETTDQRFYNQAGVGRSVSPKGALYDFKHNRSGLDFNSPDAGVSVINEIGYRVQPSSKSKKQWLRFGAVYNSSEFSQFDDPRKTDDNFGFYAIVDQQISQPDSLLPFRGWYVRGSADYSSPRVNGIAGDGGLTFYNVGPFSSRPEDLFAVAVTKMLISKDMASSLGRTGLEPAKTLTTASISYAFKVHSGIYWNNALSYTSTPTIAPQRKSAVTVISNLSINF